MHEAPIAAVQINRRLAEQDICDYSPLDPVAMLLNECATGHVDVRLGHRVTDISRADTFRVETDRGSFTAAALVLATALGLALAGGGTAASSGASTAAKGSVFTGYAFDACNASTSSSKRSRSSPRAINRAAGVSRTHNALSTSAVSAGIPASCAARAARASAARAVFV